MNRVGWEIFEKSKEWREIKAFVLGQLSDVRDELEDNHPDMDRDEAREKDIFNKGRACELRFMSEIPTMMIAALDEGIDKGKDEVEAEENNRED